MIFHDHNAHNIELELTIDVPYSTWFKFMTGEALFYVLHSLRTW